MARQPSPAKAHKAKDFCTIEQASYIAQEITGPLFGAAKARFVEHAERMEDIEARMETLELRQRIARMETPWYTRLWRAIRRAS